ncbi:MAG: hypothetical protein HQL16_06235 [Candidatus Omnitrophica bacterium]|nr:hypothetical protein [Candidatus Omnitrophota bacterium]
MAKKETAEQKLLKIIEATKKAQDTSSGNAVAAVDRKSSGKFAVNVQQLNHLLVVGVMASLIYLAYEVHSGMLLLEKNVSISGEVQIPKGALNLFVPQIRTVSYYLDKINERNIFQPFEKKETGEQGTTSAKANLEKKMKKYKLVGVAWLDVPESASVMMEDTATGATQFLKEGQKLDDVTIKTIYTDRVVVGYENEEMVIKL